jgi:hypothetical protein
VPVSYDGGKPEIEDAVRACYAFPVLLDEISLVKPEVIVFFTGPDHDPILRYVFPDLEFYRAEGFDRRSLSRVEHNKLPECSFRTRHPGYSRRTGECDAILRRIVYMCQGHRPGISDPITKECTPCPRLEIGFVDDNHFTLVAKKDPYCVWKSPKGRAYHLCIYESKPIRRFSSLDDALAEMQRRHHLLTSDTLNVTAHGGS